MRPLLLGSENYAWWKRSMKNFIKVMDDEAWRSIEEGWTQASASDGAERKSKETMASENKVENANSKALYYIECDIQIEESKIIANCTSAKDAWDTLRNQFEGNPSVRRSKLIHLNSDFENLYMNEDEKISEFYAFIKSVVNEIACLGECIPKGKIVQKVLRSLSERFDIKVTSIRDNVDTSVMRLDELIGSLQTYLMQLEHRRRRNEAVTFAKKAQKNIALKVKSRVAMIDDAQDDSQDDTNDDVLELVSRLSAQLEKKHSRPMKNRV